MTNMDVNRNFLCIRVPRNHSAPAAFVEPPNLLEIGSAREHRDPGSLTGITGTARRPHLIYEFGRRSHAFELVCLDMGQMKNRRRWRHRILSDLSRTLNNQEVMYCMVKIDNSPYSDVRSTLYFAAAC